MMIVVLFVFLILGTFKFYQVQKEFQEQKAQMIQEIDALKEDADKFRAEVEQSISCGEHKGKHELADGLQCSGISENAPQFSTFQLWLQLTYEKEKALWINRYESGLADFENVKTMVQTLRPNRTHIFAALGFVHGRTEPKYATLTHDIRKSFTAMRKMHEETEYRWKEIEKYAEFDIIENSGITQLEYILEPEFQSERTSTPTTIGDYIQPSGRSRFWGSFRLRNRKKSSMSKTGSTISLESLDNKTSAIRMNSLPRSGTTLSGSTIRAPGSLSNSRSTITGIDSISNLSIPSSLNIQTTEFEQSQLSNLNAITERTTSTPNISDVRLQETLLPIPRPLFRTVSNPLNQTWTYRKW